jgi:aldehyde:ferredoxin oxidoreductase
MKTEYGWTGKLLRVDLTKKEWSLEKTDDLAERFIGGIGFGYKILWDEITPEVSAFDPENRLVFATGPLTGTLVPTSGRLEIVSKSPRSYPVETVSRSGIGGFWGPELKYAGYDALIIQGRSDKWMNLLIQDDSIEFKDAEDYISMDTYSTQTRLRKELGEKTKILCIGPAGEKLSRLAIILSETSFSAGRSGFGAVMGSKKLKAIAVRGTNPVKVFDPSQIVKVAKEARYLLENDPRREWTTRAHVLEYINRYRKKNVGCFGCPVQCFAYIEVPGVMPSATHCVDYYYYSAATEYYGKTLERDQAICEGYVLANRFGLDTYEFSKMINLLKDLFANGLIDSDSDLPLEKIGSREFIIKLFDIIIRRKGVGDLFADGCVRAADEISGAWEYCSRYFPAFGSAEHADPRRDPGIALQWALDSRDPIIDQHNYLRLSTSLKEDPYPYTLSDKKAKNLAFRTYGSEIAIDLSTFKQKPEVVIYEQNKAGVKNALILCDWVFPMTSSYFTDDRVGDTSLESRFLEAVTGYALSEQELDKVGERIWNLARAIMVIEGRSRGNDTLHESYFVESYGRKGISKKDFEEAKTSYYNLRSWDEVRGWPTIDKLSELNLQDVAAVLEKMGFYIHM